MILIFFCNGVLQRKSDMFLLFFNWIRLKDAYCLKLDRSLLTFGLKYLQDISYPQSRNEYERVENLCLCN